MSEAKKASAIAKVLRQSRNEWTNKWFAIGIGAIMALFAIYHWSSLLWFYYGPRGNSTLIKINRYVLRLNDIGHE